MEQMRLRRTKAALLTVGLAAAMVACGEAGEEDNTDVEQEVEETTDFPEGSQMAEFAEQGSIRIGVKYDQPGIGFLGAGDDRPSGFDIEIGELIAGKLGIQPDDIDWVETISDNREPFLQEDKVDIVIASYSITPERRAIVGQMGPYYITGQQLLVREEDKDKITGVDDVKGVEVCSVTGSTSLEQIETEGGIGRGFETYSECVEQVRNGSIDAMTTDGAILLGYEAETPDELQVVGDEFSEELYGIGYFPPDDTEFCNFLRDTVQEAMDSGDWATAFEATLGESGIETPEPPEMDPCP
jgi:glutamate transport system substrate-binding protein